MNFRITAILLGILAALVSFITLYESKIPTQEEREAQARRLISFDSKDVRRFQIQIGNTLTSCVREKDGWQLAHPLRANADRDKVEEILSALAAAQFEREVELPKPTAPPRAELTVWVRGKPVRIQFGENTPLGPNLYIKIEGRPRSYVVNAALFSQVIVNADDLRDRRVFAWDANAVETLEVTSGKGTVKVERKQGTWLAGARPCDNLKVESFLYRLNGLRVLDFLGSGKVQKKEIQIKVRLQGGKTQTLVVGEAKQEGVCVVAEGGIQKSFFTLSAQEKEPLKVTLNDFKEEKKEPS